MPGSYREVFRASDQPPPDPGRVFYTITAADVGMTLIPLAIDTIRLDGWFGRVTPGDVGKRLYRVPCDAEGRPSGTPDAGWIWAENDGGEP
jgi:hypothetical protein